MGPHKVSLSGFFHLNANGADPPTVWLKCIHFLAGSLLRPLRRPRPLHPHLRADAGLQSAALIVPAAAVPLLVRPPAFPVDTQQVCGRRARVGAAWCTQPPLPIAQLHTEAGVLLTW